MLLPQGAVVEHIFHRVALRPRVEGKSSKGDSVVMAQDTGFVISETFEIDLDTIRQYRAAPRELNYPGAIDRFQVYDRGLNPVPNEFTVFSTYESF